MAKNKNQHYISAFYLSNFANKQQIKDSKKNRLATIWHYEKLKDRIKERPIDNLATEPYIFSFKNDDGEYDHSLDDKLKEVEQLAAKAFSELSNIVASFKKGVTKEIEIDDVIFERIISFIVWQIRRHPDLVSDVHRQCIDLCKEKEWKLKPKEMALEVIGELGKDKYSDFESVFREKNKSIIFITSTNASFVTTDEPLVRFNKSQADGIGHESTEIYFPLASNMLLCLQGKGNRKTFRVENDRKFIRKLNVFIAQKSKRHIFGATKEHVASIVKHIKVKT